MREYKNIPLTITEAQTRVRILTVSTTPDYTLSNSRTIPYVDLYHSRNSLMETPTQQIQRAAEDEKARALQS